MKLFVTPRPVRRRTRRSPSWGAWIETARARRETNSLYGRSPSWGAWIETSSRPHGVPYSMVAPPRGERGLKLSVSLCQTFRRRVAPPRGERGLKHQTVSDRLNHARRSPSWGAWIETIHTRKRVACVPGRSPSWGAWIETPASRWSAQYLSVAPPRGERGLKHTPSWSGLAVYCRSPSWGAWIETVVLYSIAHYQLASLPLVGSVD